MTGAENESEAGTAPVYECQVCELPESECVCEHDCPECGGEGLECTCKTIYTEEGD